ncbi:nucleoside transporter [uncultured Caulobacter sp.]|uniref:oxygen-responsive sensory/signaling system negative regulator FixT n=1 Tax=uncultured Caulobacter sp. TaxID=158749 RepID=UPI002622925D|nr:nucleoside transporter [uncultured Caulobacter sp.]
MCDLPGLTDHVAVPRLILLLVADEPLRDALRFSLETEGYAVNAPASPEACQLCADCRAAACVVIDDGLTPLPVAAPGRPTVVLTGDAQRFRRRGGDGAVFLLEKPLLNDSLGRELAALLAVQ